MPGDNYAEQLFDEKLTENLPEIAQMYSQAAEVIPTLQKSMAEGDLGAFNAEEKTLKKLIDSYKGKAGVGEFVDELSVLYENTHKYGAILAYVALNQEIAGLKLDEMRVKTRKGRLAAIEKIAKEYM